MAFDINENEFIFLISVLSPRAQPPALLHEMLTSLRIEPSCILQSEMPRYFIVSLSIVRYSFTSATLEKSGSVTISISGTPARL